MSVNPKLAAIHEETKTPLSAKTTISLHPDSLIPHAEPLTADDAPLAVSVYKSGRETLRKLHETVLVMQEATEAMSVPTNVAVNAGGRVMRSQVPPERRAELHGALATAFASAARIHDGHTRTITEAIDKLEQKVASVLEDPKRNEVAAQHVASEVREVLRQYPPEQRVAAIHGAIKDGDIVVTRAVLSATPFAVGLQKVDQDMLRQMAAERFAPAEFTQIAHAKKVRDKVEKAGSLFVGQFQKLLPDLKANPREAALAKLKGGV